MHEENVVKIISANNKIVNDRIDQLEKKIDDIQESLEYTENDLKVKLTQFEQGGKITGGSTPFKL